MEKQNLNNKQNLQTTCCVVLHNSCVKSLKQYDIELLTGKLGRKKGAITFAVGDKFQLLFFQVVNDRSQQHYTAKAIPKMQNYNV